VTKSSLTYEEERNHFTPLYSQWYVDVQRRQTKVLQCPPGAERRANKCQYTVFCNISLWIIASKSSIYTIHKFSPSNAKFGEFEGKCGLRWCCCEFLPLLHCLTGNAFGF